MWYRKQKHRARELKGAIPATLECKWITFIACPHNIWLRLGYEENVQNENKILPYTKSFMHVKH